MFAIDTNQMIMDSSRRCKNSATQVDSAPNCPRCSSSNTKFCYYNNYSLSQPRYFCKGCRRYWTNGGSLRNVPVGGGCRKSRRAKSSSARKNCNSSSSGSSSSDSLIQENGSNNGSEIDLAAVFAKFLNHESSQNEFSDQELASFSVTNSLDTPESHDQIQECNNDLLEELLATGNQCDQNQEMVNLVKENQEFGLQNFVGDEIVQDVLWSEAETNSLSGISWQLPNDHDHQVQLQQQDFDSFSVDDQVNVSGNFMSDQNSWSSFDNSSWQLPSFQSFSRPY